jgi:predicted negative regulator of RcsB-dependent stress response
VLVAKKAWDEALQETATALKLVSNHASAKLAEADALAGKGDIDLAIESYEKASSYGRGTPAPFIHAARACLAGHRPTTARAFADRATQSFADDAEAWEVLGDVAAATKDKPAAKSAYQKALTASAGTIDKAAVKKKLAALR